VFERAQAVGHTLWVTPHRDEERWPCGELPTQSAEDRGLPAWTARDRPIADTDVVLWYVFGINHVTRPEEWPVMPVDSVSFWLKPDGFFDRNPRSTSRRATGERRTTRGPPLARRAPVNCGPSVSRCSG
jgi:primary-amine oxidase